MTGRRTVTAFVMRICEILKMIREIRDKKNPGTNPGSEKKYGRIFNNQFSNSILSGQKPTAFSEQPPLSYRYSFELDHFQIGAHALEIISNRFRAVLYIGLCVQCA